MYVIIDKIVSVAPWTITCLVFFVFQLWFRESLPATTLAWFKRRFSTVSQPQAPHWSLWGWSSVNSKCYATEKNHAKQATLCTKYFLWIKIKVFFSQICLVCFHCHCHWDHLDDASLLRAGSCNPRLLMHRWSICICLHSMIPWLWWQSVRSLSLQTRWPQILEIYLRRRLGKSFFVAAALFKRLEDGNFHSFTI